MIVPYHDDSFLQTLVYIVYADLLDSLIPKKKGWEFSLNPLDLREPRQALLKKAHAGAPIGPIVLFSVKVSPLAHAVL